MNRYEIRGILIGLIVGFMLSFLMQIFSPLVEIMVVKSDPSIDLSDVSQAEKLISSNIIYVLFFITSNCLISGFSAFAAYYYSNNNRMLIAILCALFYGLFIIFNKDLFYTNIILYVGTVVSWGVSVYLAIFIGVRMTKSTRHNNTSIAKS